MTCEGCSNAVKKVLGKLGGRHKAPFCHARKNIAQSCIDKIHNVEIKLDEKLVTVDTDLGKEEVLEALRKTGKEVKSVE
jgi:copper chaperone CopZ